MNVARAWRRRGRRLLRDAARLIAAVCRELADERAYARHLAAHGRQHSAEEWRRFSDGRLKAKFARGRCC